MPTPLNISIKQARRLLLKRQYLWPPRSLRGDEGIMSFFQRMRFAQFDPVNIIGTSPCIALAARVRSFTPAMLAAHLYEHRVLNDQWDRCASIVLDEDIEALYYNRGDTNWRTRSRMPVPEEVFQSVREQLAQHPEGLPSNSFPDIHFREALLLMLAVGDVEIHHREGQRRFFALAPEERRKRYQDASFFPNREDFFRWIVQRRVGSSGLMMAYSSYILQSIRGLGALKRREVVDSLAKEGQLISLQVENLKPLFYCLPEDVPLLETTDVPSPRAAFIAPLDNMLWDRSMVHALFDFRYRWEIYTKDDKRLYGPYTLPVLYGDRLIARVQLRVDSSAKPAVLRVEQWWWEAGVKPSRTMQQAVQVALNQHAHMLGVDPDEVALL